MTTLYLVRHAENRANLTKEFSHRLVDYPLTPKGRLQAEQTAVFFAGMPIAAVYSSPLRRAMETAAAIAAPFGQEVTVLEQFREINVGDLEGEPPTEENWTRHNDVLRAWRRGTLETAFPGGEDFYALWARVAEGYGLIAARHRDATVVIVAHGGVFTSTIKALCPDVELGALLRQENHNCSISEVLLAPHDGALRGQLVRWAACDHLSGAAAELVSGVPSADFFRSPSA
jgi:2,3-bisphosphoglycerate-dependent phosphoglycerate mutase